eukprot:TRINITY_DN1379_c0_g1_i1.p1 TRINITY_DN1379_c0_g1~~TRINITY_DN1379_c0_g1_i1.p1  ORF type:complete len:1026 (-),score=224.44 TRINITY_DN1379_c0_g1_i1:172-3249(-)
MCIRDSINAEYMGNLDVKKELSQQSQINQQPPQQNQNEPQQWSCEQCTLLNDYSEQFCTMCNSKRPEQSQLINQVVEQAAKVSKSEDQIRAQELFNKKRDIEQKNMQFLKNKVQEYINKLLAQKEESNGKSEVDKLEKAEKSDQSKEQKKSEKSDQSKEQKKSEKSDQKKEEKKDEKNDEKKEEKKEKIINEEIQKTELEKALEKILNANEDKLSKISNQLKGRKEQNVLQILQLLPPQQQDQNKEVSQNKESEQKQEKNSDKQKINALQGKQICENGKASEHLQKFLLRRLIDENTGEFRPNIEKEVKNCFTRLQQSTDLIAKLNRSSDFNLESLDPVIFTNSCQGLATLDIIKFWELFQDLGYDFWLCLVNYDPIETPSIISHHHLEQLGKFVELDLCKETKNAFIYPPSEIRITQQPVPIRKNQQQLLKKQEQQQQKLQEIEQPEIIPINYDTDVIMVKYVGLEECSIRSIRYSWSLLQQINYLFSQSFPFLNFSDEKLNNNESQTYLQLSLANTLSKLRLLLVSSVKVDAIQQVLSCTASQREQIPQIQIERTKFYESSITQQNQSNQLPTLPNLEFGLKKQESSSEQLSLMENTDNLSLPLIKCSNSIQKQTVLDKDSSMFLSAFEQLKQIDVATLRPVKPSGTEPFLAFEVIFKNEHVQGFGGPYRQFFSDISSELQKNSIYQHSRNLDLFCPTVNNAQKIGESKDKYIINPSANSPLHLQQFEFLGVLMGCSFRTGTFMQLDLPSIFWKQVIGQDVLLEDLLEIDCEFVNLMRYIYSAPKTDFGVCIQDTFTTTLSNQKVVELKENGRNINLTFENRYEFITRAIRARIMESSQQIDAIRRGLGKVVPVQLLQIMNYKDIEVQICGKKTIDFALLKRHTKYGGGLSENSQLIKNFWEVITDLEPSDQVRFVKFCWGQERLPENDDAFERNNIRFQIGPKEGKLANQNLYLPRADTCFFNFQLPNYTTKEILRKQILLAIRFDCETINGDQVRPQISQNPLQFEYRNEYIFHQDNSFDE